MTCPSPETILSLSNLAFSIGNGAFVGGCPQFNVARGDCIGLVGRNGSGKTTFLRAVAGLVGSTASGASPVSSLRGLVGYTSFDLWHAFPPEMLVRDYLAGIEPVAGWGWAAPYTLHESLEGLLPTISDHVRRTIAGIESPEGLRKLLLSPISAVSSGRRQLLVLLTALSRKTLILAVDEVTSNLDPHWANMAIRLLVEHCRNSQGACIVASHDLDLVARFASSCVIAQTQDPASRHRDASGSRVGEVNMLPRWPESFVDRLATLHRALGIDDRAETA